jgi:hypothetical protein
MSYLRSVIWGLLCRFAVIALLPFVAIVVIFAGLLGEIKKEDEKMKKYKFHLSETSWIELSDKDLKHYQDANLQENKKGKIIPVEREFDNKLYGLVIPLELLEECEG